MSVHHRWRWGAAVLVLAVFALLSGAHLCGAARDAGSRPLSEGGLACTEFWLNRYQTLLGAMAALLAGWLAWRGAMSQVHRADTQIELLRYQAFSEASDRFDQYVTYIFQIHISMNRAISAQTDAINIIDELAEIYKLNGDTNNLQVNYNEIKNEIDALDRGLNMHLNKLRDATSFALSKLEEGVLPQNLHSGAVAFFGASQTELEKLCKAQMLSNAEIARGRIEVNGSIKSFRRAFGILQNREANKPLKDRPERKMIGTEFKKYADMRDRAKATAEGLFKP